MFVLFCKKLLQSCKIFLYIREMNEPMIAIRGKPFHNLLVVCIENKNHNHLID